MNNSPKTEKACAECTGIFLPSSGRQKYCTLCMDKNRNKARSKKRPPWMIVHCDLEGEQFETTFGQRMYMVTASLGREDGTRDSYIPDPVDMSKEGWEIEMDLRAKVAKRWLINRLSRHYIDKDGKKWRQQAMAFHFGWDTAVLNKAHNPDDMYLVYKVQSTMDTVICGKRHKHGDRCERYEDVKFTPEELEALEQGTLEEGEGDHQVLHRYDRDDILAVITDGGDSNVLAYDPESQIAFSATPGRRFYIEHRPNGDRFEGWRRVDIHDVGRSFVGGLENAIDEWLTEDDYFPGDREIIRLGKEQRKTGFKGFTTRVVADYSEAECVAASRMTRKLLDALKEALNLPISEPRLFGSGAIAASALKHFGVPKAKDCDLSYEDTAQLTYFGGLIEADVVGLIPMTVDELDINSAYPSKMVHLPCMLDGHGEWVAFEEDNFPADATVGHIMASWYCYDLDTGKPVDTSTAPFTVRYKGGRVVSGMWCEGSQTTLPEYCAAKKRFDEPWMIEGLGGRYWNQTCECPPPFQWLEKIYNERLNVKAKMKEVVKKSPEWNNLNVLQLAYKLVINSIYGKLAQQRPNRSSYTNFHLAAYITGATRAQVREESWLREAQGGTVVYQHTDSVLSVGGTPEDGGKALGAWGLEKDKITKLFFCLQPGLAADLDVRWNEDKQEWETDGKVATRGCRPQDFLKAALVYVEEQDLTLHPTQWNPMKIRQRVMNSWRQSLAQGKPELAGAFLDKVFEFTPASHKRDLGRAVPFTYAPDPDKPHEIVVVPTAWRVPPAAHIDSDMLASVTDLKQHQSMLDKRYKSGEFDIQGG